MASRPSFKNLKGEAAPAPAAAEPPAPKPAKPGSREGKHGVMCYVGPEAWLQLRTLSLKERRSAQDLMLEAIDMLFADRNLQRIARMPNEQT